ncbi:arylamine N-acetyltransferase [Planomonospora corallina]|uniref:Arylamine N-acetyltransferase n=1 Tax=Planomonospora corallina TaxID=1806052 RepID=A0ABV8IE51_9ACTN
MTDNTPASDTPASEWGAGLLDLDAYLRRIGRPVPAAPTVESLRELHRAHVTAIPFENLDVLLDRGVRLDIGSIQAKLVESRRGGYCYEHNLLFAAVLERLGYRVTRLLARVGPLGERRRPRTHAMLLAEAGGTRHLVDVGFGGEGLLEPLPFADGAVSQVGPWSWRLGRAGDEWVLSTLRPDGWAELYAFRLEVHHPVDFEVSNHYTSTAPASPFVRHVIVQRTTPGERHRLQGLELDGNELKPGELHAVLEEVFGIGLGPEEAETLVRHVTSAN